MLVVRTELQQQRESKDYFDFRVCLLYHVDIGSGVAHATGYPELRILLHTLTDPRSSGRMLQQER